MSSAQRKLSSIQLSLLIHGALIGIGIGFQYIQPKSSRKIPVEVIEYPAAAPANLQLQASRPTDKPKPPPEPAQKKVFGVTRKSLHSESADPNAAAVKAGNTVAKEMDDEKLALGDADSIPIPADDFLLTSQAIPLSQVRAEYPKAAREAQIEGPVIMDVVIDDQGQVRQVNLIRGPGYGLDEAAVEALKKFKFRPAQIADKTVAVKIRYTYRFNITDN